MKAGNFFKRFFTALASPFRWFGHLFSFLGKGASGFYSFSDKVVKKSVEKTGDVMSGTKSEGVMGEGKKGVKLIFLIAVILAVVLLFSVVIMRSIYAVPVGGGAVVTRFGAVNRNVGMGVHFKIPFIERYYIVQTEFLRQESFGFVQVNASVQSPRLSTAQRQGLSIYKNELLNREQDPATFSRRGALVPSLRQGQRLTHDYLREQLGLQGDNTPEEIAAIEARNAQEKAVLKSKGVSPNGRFFRAQKSYYITGDLGLVLMHWSIQYEITNMENYLFNSGDVQENLRDISLAQMSEVIGRVYYMGALTKDRSEIEKQALEGIRSVIKRLKLGLTITKVIILDLLPPPEVVPAFNDVTKAQQDKQRYIFRAERAYQNTIPKAHGEAKRIVATAKAYAISVVNKADGDAGRFSLILKQYQLKPAITRDRLYIETMSRLFRKSPITVLDPKIQGVLPVFTPGFKGLSKKNIAAIAGMQGYPEGSTSILPPGYSYEADAPAIKGLEVESSPKQVTGTTVSQSPAAAASVRLAPAVTATAVPHIETTVKRLSSTPVQ